MPSVVAKIGHIVVIGGAEQCSIVLRFEVVRVTQYVNKPFHFVEAVILITFNLQNYKNTHTVARNFLNIFSFELSQKKCKFAKNLWSHTMNPQIENHPFEPFLPEGARVLMLGTFPPKPERWSMEFYYPNKINDMWRIMGLIFYGDKNRFWLEQEKRFDLPSLKSFLTQQRIALYDTAMRVRRLKDNASDKFLEIVETIDLDRFFALRPTIKAIVTAGEKATGVIAEKAGVEVPKTGERVDCEYHGHPFALYRMPSSSRAYPLALEKKGEAYGAMFRALGYEV